MAMKNEDNTINEIYKQIAELTLKNSGYLIHFNNPLYWFKLIKFCFGYKKLIKKITHNLLSINLHDYTENGDDKKLLEVSKLTMDFYKNLTKKYRKKLFSNYKGIVKPYIINNIKPSKKMLYTPIKDRICYCVSSSLPYHSMGYNTRSAFMEQALKEIGFDIVTIVRPGYPWDRKDIIKKYSEIPYIQDVMGIKHVFQKLQKHEMPIDTYYATIKKYKETFLEYKPEYIIAASNNDSAFCALIAAKSLGIPFYYEIRGFWEISRIAKHPKSEFEQSYAYERYMETKVAKESDAVFTLSTPMKKELVRMGVEESKIHLVPNCVDVKMYKQMDKDTELLEKLNIPKDCPVISYIGSIMVYEGLDDLVEACSILKNKNIDFRLIITGGVDTNSANIAYLKKVEKLIKELNLENNVIITGKVSPMDTPKYYSISDIVTIGRRPYLVCELVSPIKPYEAMAMGKAVVVSDTEALKEMVINNVTGVHFKKGDVNSYANILERVVCDPVFREALGKQGRKWVEENRKWIFNAKTIKDVIEKKDHSYDANINFQKGE